MKAWLVVNTFMRTVKFNNLYNMLSLAFKKHNVDLEVKTASDISLEVNQPILNKPDFALFWDKDIYLAKRLENEGIKLFNNAKAVELCDNKILMYQELARCGVRIPRTFIAPKTFEGLNYTSRDFVDNVINEIGLPLVIKEAYGSFGEQVYLANTKEEANKIIDQIGKNISLILKVEILESMSLAMRRLFQCIEKTFTTLEVTSLMVVQVRNMNLNKNT